ncbi:MAG: glycosyltransferase family 39 protein [Chloroflexi bacterium]|nr:glycosyltransferase family 39 protein [Chloroflexota bacterium]
MNSPRLKRPWPPSWPMLSIVCLAFLLRLINLNGRSLWYDEAFAILYAEKSFPTMLYGTITQIEGAAADVHPLFYYSLLHGWMALGGQSLLAVRLLSVFFSLLTVAMLYLLGKLLF